MSSRKRESATASENVAKCVKQGKPLLPYLKKTPEEPPTDPRTAESDSVGPQDPQPGQPSRQ